MKHHLNTLFLTTQGTHLAKNGECIDIRLDGKSLKKIPVHTLHSVICFGQISCSPYLLDHCAQNSVSLSWFSEYGRFMASMQGPTKGNVLLRRAQYRMTDSPEQSAELARFFTIGKISNCRSLLMRQARTLTDDTLTPAIEKLARCLHQLKNSAELNIVRGIEGDAARAYFGVFDALIKVPDMAFVERSRRPPRNEINCLLSFLYTLLAHDIRSALEGVGLDPAVGFLHRERPGRASLALDMMEEFRPYMADRLALTLINRKQICKKDFTYSESGAVLLKEKARKEILMCWQERKQEEIEHPFLNEKMTVGLLWHMQARLLARYIRGDMDAYPPFTIR